ncbi:hypothetical protein [Dysgonomonas massiliensis]|uniref:hypothetical protein n=1 Tax=Dysgonomonas massiliensis TaxID=2040292 RepID=UPI000C766404|nr:hypothetical protein [Dysgonomonas massiliensis]
MIIPEIKIHDKFSIETKVGFVPDQNDTDFSEFKINTWIYVPNSLDINRSTYTKEQFYRDTKNNIRLITPVYTIAGILEEGRGPIPRLQRAIGELLGEPDSEAKTENYLYQVKMFACITKSALRDQTNFILCERDNVFLKKRIDKLVEQIREISERFRSQYSRLEVDTISDKQRDYFLFGDEFWANTIAQHVFRIMVAHKNNPEFAELKKPLVELLLDEQDYKRKMGYQLPVEGNDDHNKLLVIKRTALKKFVESDLYLHVTQKKDGALTEQVLYGIAAGVAMIFATVISFFATQRFGNFTTDLFIILVISYIGKDRIKDLMRYYFSSHMSRKYFDHKRKLNVRNQEIGWIKESFDVIPEERVPEEIQALRNRSPLVEAENQIYDEKVMMYRKLVRLSRKDIEKYKQYRLTGINDITRFNLSGFVQKMADPTLPLYMVDADNGYKTIKGYKEYPLYMIIACVSNNETYYRKYRLLVNKKGISDVSELD